MQCTAIVALLLHGLRLALEINPLKPSVTIWLHLEVQMFSTIKTRPIVLILAL